jgi:hypothetical protein
MRTSLIALATAAAAFATGAADAQMKAQCTQAEMDRVQTQTSGMADKKKQGMAMKEMKMAGDMMKKNDMKGCMMHLDKADKAAMKKM